jgi:hypothetical protein
LLDASGPSLSLRGSLLKEGLLDIREVAKKTGVSIATVSRAINLLPSMNPSLARRIRRVASECGYFPNSYARSLVSGKRKLFGLVVPDITNPFFAAIVEVLKFMRSSKATRCCWRYPLGTSIERKQHCAG